jgi:hypothetical protein
VPAGTVAEALKALEWAGVLIWQNRINNFWRALANQPALLERTWASVKEVMVQLGLLDPLTRELVRGGAGEGAQRSAARRVSRCGRDGDADERRRDGAANADRPGVQRRVSRVRRDAE